jgi:hypothetical protein
MVSTGDAFQLVGAGVIVLIGLCLSIAWIPARGRYPGGLPARVFVTLGLFAVAWEPAGLGVLGGVLAAMGGAIWWAGQPDPELPRPRRVGLIVAAIITGALTLATMLGWGVLSNLPEQARVVATPFVAGVGALGTLAIADRARITYREALRRRLRSLPQSQFASFGALSLFEEFLLLETAISHTASQAKGTDHDWETRGQ